jgi:acetyl-CoA carboxylase biotin carboxyl carrier protein
MTLDQIKILIDAMAASDLNEMEFSEDGWSLKLVRRPQPSGGAQAPAKTVSPSNKKGRPVRTEAVAASGEGAANVAAPLFGIVYLRPAPDAPAFVSIGQIVTAGTPLCIIEAMKMFHEVRAERDGTVSAILVASGQEVEAGQELMRFA